MKKQTHTYLGIAAMTLAALSANGQFTVDFVDSVGLTNTSTVGDNLLWSTTVGADALTITVSTSDTDFDAWAANTGKLAFGYNTTRGTAWANAIDGDPDNNTDINTLDPVPVVGESVTFSFSSPVDLGTAGLLLRPQKLGEGLTDAATAAVTVVYQYSINGGGLVDGFLPEGDFGGQGFGADFNVGSGLTGVSSLTLAAVAGIQGGFRPQSLEIAAVVPEPGAYAALLGLAGLALVVIRRRRG